MSVLKLFTRDNCPLCPTAKRFADLLRKEGLRVIDYDLNTAEGLAESVFHQVASLPALVLVDKDDRDLASWCGCVPPLEEVKDEYQHHEHEYAA